MICRTARGLLQARQGCKKLAPGREPAEGRGTSPASPGAAEARRKHSIAPLGLHHEGRGWLAPDPVPTRGVPASEALAGPRQLRPCS